MGGGAGAWGFGGGEDKSLTGFLNIWSGEWETDSQVKGWLVGMCSLVITMSVCRSQCEHG